MLQGIYFIPGMEVLGANVWRMLRGFREFIRHCVQHISRAQISSKRPISGGHGGPHQVMGSSIRSRGGPHQQVKGAHRRGSWGPHQVKGAHIGRSRGPHQVMKAHMGSWGPYQEIKEARNERSRGPAFGAQGVPRSQSDTVKNIQPLKDILQT